MKTESFDDAIRRKVASIHPQWVDEDIGRVHNYVNAHKVTKSFWARHALMLAGSSCALILFGLCSFILNQQYEHKILRKTIDSLNVKLYQEKNYIPKEKIDTVYVTQYINKKESGKSNAAIISTNASGKGYMQLAEHGDNLRTKTGKSSSNKDIQQASAAPVEDFKNDASPNDISKGSPKRTFANAPVKEHNVNNLHDQKSLKRDSAISKSNIKEKPAKNRLNETRNIPLAKNKKTSPSFFFKNLNYRAGMGFEIANQQMGGSVLGEVFWNEHWSMNVGFKVLNITNEQFDGADDFLNRKGHNFNSVYAPYVSDTSAVANINRRTLLLQVPLSLVYHVALRNDFSLLFSLGTDIDLYSKQNIEYKLKGIGNANLHISFEVKYPVLMFNNAVLSAGMEKRWKCFVVQAIPFISPQITSVVYKKEDLYFGINLRALYSFGDY